jgi:formate hydrogenlyase transcriptional activator
MSAYQTATDVLSDPRKVFPAMLPTGHHGEGVELQRERSCMTLLLNLMNQVTAHQDLRGVLRAVMTNVRGMVPSDGAIFILRDQQLRDPESGELRVYALDLPSGSPTLREGLTIPFEGSVAGRVFLSGKPWAGTVQETSALSPGFAPLLLRAGFRFGCQFPILSRSRVVAVLALGRTEGGLYGAQELDFLERISSHIAMAVENALAFQEIKALKEQLAREELNVEDEISNGIPGEDRFGEIVGRSAVLRRVLQHVETVAPTDSTVLICGETGTGKELIARAIHNLSSRNGSAFVKLNCAAIPTGLLESELFGHEKGAFTGAVTQRVGRFELAHRGTVFLDEVGEIPLELQTKLLRVLQEREFERLGSTRTIHTDARLIAATNRDLSEMVEDQQFRSDLFYRLNVFPVRVPALRERPEDIPMLVRHFAQRFARRMHRKIDTIPSETMAALTRHQWPGNIRELQNLIERAVILSPASVLQVPLQDLGTRSAPASGKSQPQPLAEAERAHILNALKETKWIIAGPQGAAARLGMNRSTVQFRMKKLGIVRPWQ